ncbi:MAG: hypothetical protein ABSE84_13250, partial [Isosphaeraceae bacterium]
YHPIHIARTHLDRDLGYSSKLDRKREFLDELMEYGKSKARWFLKEREGRKYTMQALGVFSSDGAPVAAR